ncbi:Beta-lactamase (fragment) [Candidatus Zixiibacteriota bacterium]
MTDKFDLRAETEAVENVIKDSIRWAMTKDTDMLYRSFMPDSSLFWFSPDDAGTVKGIDNFKELVETVFMSPSFKAVSSDFKDLKITFSHSGECAWWSCYLDDFNEWNGKPSNWENVRWTGVLEKIDGAWRIRQMHFSYSLEFMRAEIKRAVSET